jgi:hypothetical protein
MKNIPSVDRIKDVELRNILSAIKEGMEILAGQRGSINDRALLVKDLTNLGLLRVHNEKTLYDPNKAEAQGFAETTVQRAITIGGLSGTFEAIDPVTLTTKTFTITGGTVTGMA